ncbi:MAG: hypothetical protein QWI73_06000 [Alphaproteobacteria bacterium]|nr:hypothetical protein [Alphaproteobacteria bacterium]
MSTIKARKLVFLQTDQQWHHYEVLTNPERLNLFWALVDLRQSKKPSAKDHLMAPRPVLAGHLGDPSVPPPFVARAEVDDVSFVGVVQETNDNGTTAFYYGLYNVVDLNSIRVINVMNTQPPSKEEEEEEVIDGMTPKRKPQKPKPKPKPNSKSKPKPKPNKE